MVIEPRTLCLERPTGVMVAPFAGEHHHAKRSYSPRPGRTLQGMGSTFKIGYINVVLAVLNLPTDPKEEV